MELSDYHGGWAISTCLSGEVDQTHCARFLQESNFPFIHILPRSVLCPVLVDGDISYFQYLGCQCFVITQWLIHPTSRPNGDEDLISGAKNLRQKSTGNRSNEYLIWRTSSDGHVPKIHNKKLEINKVTPDSTSVNNSANVKFLVFYLHLFFSF